MITKLVRRVYSAINKPLHSDDAVLHLCDMADDAELNIRACLFEMTRNINAIKLDLNNGNYKWLMFEQEHCLKLKSYIDSKNRSEELVFVHLKKLLAPYWKFYWGEGCNDLNIIATWLDRAEKDSFIKLNIQNSSNISA